VCSRALNTIQPAKPDEWQEIGEQTTIISLRQQRSRFPAMLLVALTSLHKLSSFVSLKIDVLARRVIIRTAAAISGLQHRFSSSRKVLGHFEIWRSLATAGIFMSLKLRSHHPQSGFSPDNQATHDNSHQF